MKNDKKTFVLCVKENIEQINYYAISETSEEKAIEFFKTYNKDQHTKAIKTIVVHEHERIENVYNEKQFRKLLEENK